MCRRSPRCTNVSVTARLVADKAGVCYVTHDLRRTAASTMTSLGIPRLVVAKILRPGQVAEERALGELREEAEVLDALAHPVIVRGFDAVLEGPHPHVLLEHLEGPSLRRLVKRGGLLPLQQLLPLALHVAGALQYMEHRRARSSVPRAPPARSGPTPICRRSSATPSPTRA